MPIRNWSITLLALALSACSQTPVESLVHDLDGDGIPDSEDPDITLPPRGGPFDDCHDAALHAATNDACSFEIMCFLGETMGEQTSIACLGGHVVRTTWSYDPTTSTTPCGGEASIDVGGSCADTSGGCFRWAEGVRLGAAEPGSAYGRPTTHCVEEGPLHDLPDAPHRLVDDHSCAALVEAQAENGDPCTGAYVCTVHWGFQAAAWCDAGELRIVAAQEL